MGKHFALIADEVVKPLAPDLQGSPCDGCGGKTPLYFLFGPAWYVALGLRGRLVRSTDGSLGVQRFCFKCMGLMYRGASRQGWKIQCRSLRSPGGPDWLWPLRRLALARELARTPPYAFFAQRRDWPVCCRRCCEYQGYPADAGQLEEVARTHQFWESGRSDRRPFEDGSMPADPSTDVNLFACRRCGSTFYTYQTS